MWYKTFDIQGNTGYIEGDTSLKSTNVYGQKMVLNEDYVKLYKGLDTNGEVLSVKLSGLEIYVIKFIKRYTRE